MLLNRRYLSIVLFFGRIVLNFIFWEIILRRLGFRALANRTAQARYTAAARRFRAVAIRMGGVLIKVGQFLSSRVDVLPDYITEELSGLQDEVPAETFSRIRTVAEAELKGTLTEKFASFDETPLAAASLGQAHRATLSSGEKVVIKIQRPNIEHVVEIDLAALRTVVSWLKHYRPISKRANVEALLAEFSATLRDELNYVAEAQNAVRFADMFNGNPGVRIPKLYPGHSTLRVLALEDVYFIKITDYAAITAAGINRADVAERLFQTYLYQIFNVGFFHADPHPGNLFVEPANGEHDWRLIFVDFGMVGQITPAIRAALREAAVAVGTRDPARLVHSFVAANALLPGADVDRIIEAETAVFDRFWGKSMKELRQTDPREMRKFMRQFRDLMFELPFQVPENLIYLGRTVAILSGMCTGLNPDFNLFLSITPFAQTLLAEETGDGGLDFWLNEILEWGRKLVALPARLDSALTRIERGEITVISRPSPEQKLQADRLSAALNRLTGGLVFTALLAVGAMLYLNEQPALGAFPCPCTFPLAPL
ncbi:MAG: AarF/ABC1/UbiB kinase family protein [Chloroflexi bacterium]|nr:AarF/ABC1/UbiB kinase family protein [Chloroflexota bacterium]